MDLRGLDKEWRGFSDHDIRRAKGEGCESPRVTTVGDVSPKRHQKRGLTSRTGHSKACSVQKQGEEKESEDSTAEATPPLAEATPPPADLRERLASSLV